MNEQIESFIKSCLELGKELLDKETLTKKEEEFIENLDLITDKYLNNNTKVKKDFN